MPLHLSACCRRALELWQWHKEAGSQHTFKRSLALSEMVLFSFRESSSTFLVRTACHTCKLHAGAHEETQTGMTAAEHKMSCCSESVGSHRFCTGHEGALLKEQNAV